MKSIKHRQKKGCEKMHLGMVESRFADIVWEHAPLTSRELVDLCEKELNWKRTTTYTVLKKFCERGLFQHEKKMITVLMTKEEFYAKQGVDVVEEAFNGSLPAFVAAFASRKELAQKEILELEQLIDKLKGGNS